MPILPIDTLLDRARRTKDVRLSLAEVEGLEAVAAQSLTARRLLAMHYFAAGAYDRLVPHARALFDAEPSPEAAKNLFSALLRARRHDEALALGEAHADAFDPIDLADSTCGVLARLGRYEDAADWGRRALDLKDAAAPHVERPAPVLHRFDPQAPSRNVIAFSLFGTGERYLRGALRNAVVIQHLYPGWTARFYVDSSVPAAVIDQLKAERAEVLHAPKLDAARYGLFWRFLVEDDPNVDLYLVRDVDSVVNIRERAAVEDWLASGKPYHVMRDYPSHCELMLAGMWGAHRGNLGPIGPRILAHVTAYEARINDRATDQLFLREAIWPLVRRDALVHDAWFRHGTSRPFPEGFALPWPMHVGQNDSARTARRAAPEGDPPALR